LKIKKFGSESLGFSLELKKEKILISFHKAALLRFSRLVSKEDWIETLFTIDHLVVCFYQEIYLIILVESCQNLRQMKHMKENMYFYEVGFLVKEMKK